MWVEPSHSTPDRIKRYKPPTPYSVLPLVPPTIDPCHPKALSSSNPAGAKANFPLQLSRGWAWWNCRETCSLCSVPQRRDATPLEWLVDSETSDGLAASTGGWKIHPIWWLYKTSQESRLSLYFITDKLIIRRQSFGIHYNKELLTTSPSYDSPMCVK